MDCLEPVATVLAVPPARSVLSAIVPAVWASYGAIESSSVLSESRLVASAGRDNSKEQKSEQYGDCKHAEHGRS